MKKITLLFLDKYKQLSLPVKASIWFTICSVFQKGIALLTTPIFTRILTTEQYGIFTVYQSWYNIIIIFATLNLFLGVFNNGMTKFSDDRLRFISSLQGLSTGLTCLLFIVYIVDIPFWTNVLELEPIFIFAMFIQLLLEPAYFFWATSQRYDYKYKTLVLLTIGSAIISPLIGSFAVISTQYKAEARVLSFVFIQACIGLILYGYNMYKGRQFFNWKYWKYALLFNIPLIPHYLSTTVLNQVDRIMISHMVGSSEAAIYSVAYSISTMMTIIVTAVNYSFIPYSYKSLKKGEVQGIRNNANFLLALVGITCFLAMAFGPEIVSIFASPAYYDAIWIMPSVSASVYFVFMYSLFGNIEFYFEKTKFIAVASCLGAGANILLNLIFIRIYGYYAAGYTTLVCYVLFAVAHFFFHKKVIRQKMPEVKQIYDSRFVLVFSIFVLAMVVLMTWSYKHIFIRYGIILVMFSLIIIIRKTIISKMKEFRK